MRRRRDPHYDTDPASVFSACSNGWTTNPMYRRCDICTRELCTIRGELKLDKILREDTDRSIGVPYDPQDLSQENQMLKYFGWIKDRPEGYDILTVGC